MAGVCCGETDATDDDHDEEMKRAAEAAMLATCNGMT